MKARAADTLVALAEGDALTLDILVALNAKGEAPTEFRIFNRDEVKTRKGSFLFDEAAGAAVMKHAEEFGAEYPLDYGHAMLGGGMFGHADPAEGNKAAGWFKPQLRKGELWATDVTWTPRAAKMLSDREFRYVSPAFKAKEVELDGGKRATRIDELINVALTNVPATKGLTPLVLHGTTNDDPGTSPAKERDMTMIALATLAGVLGLATSASEREVLARASETNEAVGELARATGKDKPKEAVGIALSWQAQARTIEVERKVDAKIEAKQLSKAQRDWAVKLGMRDPDTLDGFLSTCTVKLEASETEVERKVKEKIDAFLLTPARKDWAVKLGTESPALFEEFLASLTTKVVAGSTNDQPRGKAVDRDPRVVVPDADTLRVLGMSAEKFIETQTKMMQEGVL